MAGTSTIAALGLVLALRGASGEGPTAGPACPNVAPGSDDEVVLGGCLADGKAAKKEGRFDDAARAYRSAHEAASRRYTSGKRGAEPAWFNSVGQEFVYHGTRGCELTDKVEPQLAHAMLDECLRFVDDYLGDLERVGAGESTAARDARKQRDAWADAQGRLPALEVSADLESAPEEARDDGQADAGGEERSDPPPSRDEDGSRAQKKPRSKLDARSRGLYAGLGVSLGVAVLSSIGLGVSSFIGQRAQNENFEEHRSARALFVTSGVGLGVSLAATAVFSGLLIRRAYSRRVTASGGPIRTGFLAGVTVRF